jgi:DNA-binding MarR family transcriptional regulator
MTTRADGLDELLRLDNLLCFALHAASRAFDSVYRPLLRDAGITYPQYLVMLTLWEHRELTVKELGRLLRLDSGTLSPLLKRLEAAGYVERRRGTEDERSVTVTPTAAGEVLREKARAVAGGIASATGLEWAEASELRGRLNNLIAALDAAAATQERSNTVATQERSNTVATQERSNTVATQERSNA